MILCVLHTLPDGSVHVICAVHPYWNAAVFPVQLDPHTRYNQLHSDHSEVEESGNMCVVPYCQRIFLTLVMPFLLHVHIRHLPS